MKANEIRKGHVIQDNGKLILIRDIFVQSPHSRGGSTLYKVTGSDVQNGQKYERSFKGDEVVDAIELSRREVQLLFHDSDSYTFMDNENYEQYSIASEALNDIKPFLFDGFDKLLALINEGQLLTVELPATMTMEIVECAPAMKTASSSARTKPATLSTGLVVQVPEYLTPGEVIKINTITREYMSRA
jgi:elongation factor P